MPGYGPLRCVQGDRSSSPVPASSSPLSTSPAPSSIGASGGSPGPPSAAGCSAAGGGGPPWRLRRAARIRSTFTAAGWVRGTWRSSYRSGSEGSASGRYSVSTVSTVFPGLPGSAQARKRITLVPRGRLVVGWPVAESSQAVSRYPSRRRTRAGGSESAWSASARRRVASGERSRISMPAASGYGVIAGRVVSGRQAARKAAAAIQRGDATG